MATKTFFIVGGIESQWRVTKELARRAVTKEVASSSLVSSFNLRVSKTISLDFYLHRDVDYLRWSIRLKFEK